MGRNRRAIAAVTCCLLVSSCSWVSVVPPPADETDAGDCTESRLAPAFDTTLATIFGLTVLVVAARCSAKSSGTAQDGSPAEPCSTGAYVGAGATAVLGVAATISAIQGFRHTARCRERRARLGL